jgi:hypothetical protein
MGAAGREETSVAAVVSMLMGAVAVTAVAATVVAQLPHTHVRAEPS